MASLRSSVIGSNAGSGIVQHITSPIILSRNSIVETGRTCIGRKNNLQSIKHITQITKEKYFCILAYKHETDYKGLSHRQKMWPSRAIQKRTNQPGLTEGKSCNRALKFLRLSTFTKCLSTSLYRKEYRPLLASPA